MAGRDWSYSRLFGVAAAACLSVYLRSFFSSSTMGRPPTKAAEEGAGAGSSEARVRMTASDWMAISRVGARISAWMRMGVGWRERGMVLGVQKDVVRRRQGRARSGAVLGRQVRVDVHEQEQECGLAGRGTARCLGVL